MGVYYIILDYSFQCRVGIKYLRILCMGARNILGHFHVGVQFYGGYNFMGGTKYHQGL